MLFNSLQFVFGFLPITLAVYYLLRRFCGARAALAWLTAASLFFYGWWNPLYLLLLVGSIWFNYVVGLSLSRSGSPRLVLALGVGANLGLLGYFKYVGFFAITARPIFGVISIAEGILLPLAISFFTFQQIAYLVDAYRGGGGERSFLRYCLFVSFFPQLIAGPIVHHREMLPQLIHSRLSNLSARNLAVGGTIFILGLGKKVVLADTLAGSADAVFDSAAGGVTLTILEAWSGALAYTFQIYFDFSGYSDMAIGLAYMFGFRLPLNFDSPYKAGSIIDFWRRWHMTLSRFLRNYLYIPLGGNRKGERRRYVNLMVTMVLGGLWHGAGRTFVAWGGLHGLFLVINHVWIELRGRHPNIPDLPPFVSHGLTLFAVVIAWVFFRAVNFGVALDVLAAMAGFNGTSLPEGWAFHVSIIGLSAFIALALPDSQKIMVRFSPAIERPRLYRGWLARSLLWRPKLKWAAGISLIMGIVIIKLAWDTFSGTDSNEYIYFQF